MESLFSPLFSPLFTILMLLLIVLYAGYEITKLRKTIQQYEELFKNKEENGKTKFTIKCEMKSRWVPHFLAMLKYMEQLGNIGGSRQVCIYSDGDGDFRPKFTWDKSLPQDAEPIVDDNGHKLYDAG